MSKSSYDQRIESKSRHQNDIVSSKEGRRIQVAWGGGLGKPRNLGQKFIIFRSGSFVEDTRYRKRPMTKRKHHKFGLVRCDGKGVNDGVWCEMGWDLRVCSLMELSRFRQSHGTPLKRKQQNATRPGQMRCRTPKLTTPSAATKLPTSFPLSAKEEWCW